MPPNSAVIAAKHNLDSDLQIARILVGAASWLMHEGRPVTDLVDAEAKLTDALALLHGVVARRTAS